MPSITHLGSSLVATTFALGEELNSSGEEIIEAFVIGFDVAGRIGRCAMPSHYKYWHPTATFGGIGAAVAAAKLLKLESKQIEMTIGLAADAAGGLRYGVDNGDFSKSLHPAMAAMKAVLFAQLIKNGATGPLGILEYSSGFLNAFSEEPNFEPLLDRLGEYYEISVGDEIRISLWGQADLQEIFIVDNEFKPIGTVPSSKVLRTARDTKMISIMNESQLLIPVDMDREEVGHLFENYNLNSACVVDKGNKLVGMITSDDVLTVLKEEAEEDALRLAGVGDEEITDGIIKKTKRRFNWLLLNLFTAIIASVVIGFFQDDIEKVVALAVLMPIVASMGGNAGMQTLAVTIRSIATNELTKNNFSQNVIKEFTIGILNGIIFAIISAIVVHIWFNDLTLSLIISISMVLNMIVAGLFGILVPITLKKFNIDPAIASSVFVTTITDVFGFLSF